MMYVLHYPPGEDSLVIMEINKLTDIERHGLMWRAIFRDEEDAVEELERQRYLM